MNRRSVNSANAIIDGDRIICPDVPGMAELLEGHGMTFTREVRRFTPIGQITDHGHV